MRRCLWIALLLASYLAPPELCAQALSVGGGPGDSGYNVGSTATIRASLKGVEGGANRYAVFADIQYAGTTAVTSVQMDQQTASAPGDLRYEAAWPIPSDAPTGLYTVVVHVEDRSTHQTVATEKLRSFAVYRKPVRIVRTDLDKTFYSPGEAVQCEVVLQNLTDHEMTGLRIEFSNANYPWISTFSGEANLSGKQPENPALALKVLRENLALPAHGETTLPMMPAGMAAFLQGTQVAVLGAGGPARHEKIPPPEVDQYTIAVWNADRSVLYDMQFSPRAIVRAPDRDLPKPYSNNFTHPYNSDIDFTKYREFYAPGYVSNSIRVDRARTLYRRGERMALRAGIARPRSEEASQTEVRVSITDADGKEASGVMLSYHGPASGKTDSLALAEGETGAPDKPGVYSMTFSVRAGGKPYAETAAEIAVNNLPASLLVFCPHEDDEYPYAGLIGHPGPGRVFHRRRRRRLRAILLQALRPKRGARIRYGAHGRVGRGARAHRAFPQ